MEGNSHGILLFCVSYDIVFACGYPNKSSVYLIVLVVYGAQKTLLFCSFRSSIIFFLLGSRFPTASRRGKIPALLFFYRFVKVCHVPSDSSNSTCLFLTFFFVYIYVLK